jgi:hypothetical protein
MTGSDWTGYVGMVTGLIGATMGFIAYRRSNQIKALDLRIQLRKDLTSGHESIATLRDLTNRADRSRRHIQAARGLTGSGAAVL